MVCLSSGAAFELTGGLVIGKFFIWVSILLLAGIVGGYLYLFESDIPHDELVVKYGDEAATFLTLPDGSRVHYRDQGRADGPPLVLLHGSNASLFTWEGWVRELAGEFRVITVDLPGHGLTGRVVGDDYSARGMDRFLRAFADRLGLDRFALGGNSMGGGIAARFARDHPERVTKLVLVDAGGIPAPGQEQEKPLVFKLMGQPVIGDLLIYLTPRELVADAVRNIYGDRDKVSDALIDLYHDMNLHEGNRVATKYRVQAYDITLVDTMGQIAQPTLILWGAEDRLTPLAMGRSFDAGIPGSRLHVFEGAGHIPMEEIPRESAAVARDFLSNGG